MDKKAYKKLVHEAVPKSPKVKNTLLAYLFGGGICTLGQVLRNIYIYLGADKDTASTLVAVSLIALAAVLTAAGVFDKIARFAGAGTIVPITGFANSVVSPAMEFKTEGKILGTAANMFKIAGPVIVYGTAAAFVYGV
ncbi:MAG: SpoVA/SpoVAEb family sporulation membrane protein, partial [Clostridia bacterium]|nr:SpoVA/SpoVAEb family sporulation membrane protein [Clostridia bacterium]